VTTFALIHGAWGSGWHWGTVPDELRATGHEVVAPDLPCEDPEATFDDYADVVVEAVRHVDDEDLVVVGFSLGGLSAPLVAARTRPRELVYVAAMLPEPGVSLGEQFRRGDRLLLRDYERGLEGPDERGLSAWVDFEVYHRTGCHDCREPVARERFERSRAQAVGAYAAPCSLTEMPKVPTRYVLCAEDRLLNNEYWSSAVSDRLGVDPIEIPGSHSPMASRPRELVQLLTAS
jgi:pimeloyl-ACP methyl ester carboxylesterase